MIRHLIDAFVRELRMLREAHALAKGDDAAFAADTALLKAMQQRRPAAVPARHSRHTYLEAPCTTCQPSAPPLDVVAEEPRARDLAYTAGWLVERYPDVWYFEDAAKLDAFAAGVLELRLRIFRGEMVP